MTDRKDFFKQFIFGESIVSNEPLSVKEGEKLLARGRELARKGAVSSQDDIVTVFSRLSKAWSDPGYERRRQAADVLARVSDYGPEFIKAVLEEFAKILAPEYLLHKIEGAFGSGNIQGKLVAQRESSIRLIVQPAGQVLHVASGNVFIACIESLVDGIITRNINFLKMSSDDREFPVLFAESIREFDKEKVICPALSVVWWPGGSEAVENLFKTGMDRIIFWGGQEALKSWQKDLGESTLLIRHGHKISFGVVSRSGLASSDIGHLTDSIALDIAIWEQKACNCPQMIFVEESVPAGDMQRFLDSLAGSLKKLNDAFPPGRRSSDEYVEVLKYRELAMAKHFVTGQPVSVIGPETLDWTIISEEKSGEGFEPSPLNRTILIKRYSSLHALADLFREHSSYLQTVGYRLSETELSEYAVTLSSVGVTRLCPFGIMAIPTAGTPHDGGYILRDLVRFSVVEH